LEEELLKWVSLQQSNYEELNPKHGSLPSSSVYTWKIQYAEEAAKQGKKPVVK